MDVYNLIQRMYLLLLHVRGEHQRMLFHCILYPWWRISECHSMIAYVTGPPPNKVEVPHLVQQSLMGARGFVRGFWHWPSERMQDFCLTS